MLRHKIFVAKLIGQPMYPFTPKGVSTQSTRIRFVQRKRQLSATWDQTNCVALPPFRVPPHLAYAPVQEVCDRPSEDISHRTATCRPIVCPSVYVCVSV